MSNSVRPHRQQPTRLPRPWDSPGKNTGVGCHFLFQCMKVKSESEVTQSCPTLSDPMGCSPPGSPVHGIFQARVLEWVAIAFSDSDAQSKPNARLSLKDTEIAECLGGVTSANAGFSWSRTLKGSLLAGKGRRLDCPKTQVVQTTLPQFKFYAWKQPTLPYKTGQIHDSKSTA